MRVHHLDCCTMCPFGRSAVNGDGGLFERGKMVAHCLAIETDAHGVVLVDTGIGMLDVQDPSRLGPAFPIATGLRRDAKMPALPQLEALGFGRDDVRHVVLTHLDVDHAGGLPDFPKATVHVHAREKDAVLARATFVERERYRQAHVAHGPAWETYDGEGEPWKGIRAVRRLEGLPPEILAIPMPGHTRGHALVAVDTGRGWLVHAGDSYFHRSVVERGDESGMPWGIRGFEKFVAIDYDRVRDNHARLAELAKQPGVTVFSAHDPVEYERVRAAAKRTPAEDVARA